MEVPMYLNVKIVLCGAAGGTLAAALPTFPACGLLMGIV
jgi:hypothetical protein